MKHRIANEFSSFESGPRTTGIIGYGSLIHPDEIKNEFGDLNPVSIPFVLEGYIRVFNNRSVWRNPEGNDSAVLNVEPDSDRWCNIILILVQDDSRPETYEEREEGYHFERVSTDRLNPYITTHRELLDSVDRIDIPIGDRTEPDIKPIPEYVDTCLEGAGMWEKTLEAHDGDVFENGFLEDFIQTTELADGTPFSDYLNRRSIEIEQ